MAKLSPVYEVTSKGTTYYYAWRGKGAPRLLSEPGTPEFIAELAQALANRHTGDKERLSGLIIAFRGSDEWLDDLAPKTRQNWAPWLDRINDKFGGLRLAQFGREQIRPDIRQWHRSFKKTPRAADMGLQALSRLLTFAVTEGKIPFNPCLGMPHLYQNDRSDLIWTEKDFEQLKARSSPAVYTAGRLAALTSLRKSDLLRLSWSHIGPLAIEIRTGKSNQRKTTLIPIYAELRAVLDTIPKLSTKVLTNTEGQPWQTGFGSSWNKALKAAGITDLHFHDLRGTAATKFYLAGLKIREIAEILTWNEDQVERLIDRYVKRDEILIDRIRRLDANGRGTAE